MFRVRERGEGWRSLQTESWCRTEGLLSSVFEQCKCTAGLAVELNSFWQSFSTSIEEKSICQINGCVPGTRKCVDLLKRWNCMWKSSATGITTKLDLQKSSVIIQGPAVFWTCQISDLKTGTVGSRTSTTFKSLMGCSSLQFLQECGIALGLHFLHRNSSSGFHSAFPTFTLQAREPMWGFCWLLSTSILIMHSGAGEITTGCVQTPAGPNVRWT